MTRYINPIDAIQDSIARNQEIFRVRANKKRIRQVEFNHFKRIIIARLGSDPVVSQVVSTWQKDKEPAYCEVQLLGAKEWSKQEQTDIENLYKSFKLINASLWEAEKKYGDNPEVQALISEVRSSSDVRIVPFELRLMKIVGGTDE